MSWAAPQSPVYHVIVCLLRQANFVLIDLEVATRHHEIRMSRGFDPEVHDAMNSVDSDSEVEGVCGKWQTNQIPQNRRAKFRKFMLETRGFTIVQNEHVSHLGPIENSVSEA
jgi:hypothetical protein